MGGIFQHIVRHIQIAAHGHMDHRGPGGGLVRLRLTGGRLRGRGLHRRGLGGQRGPGRGGVHIFPQQRSRCQHKKHRSQQQIPPALLLLPGLLRHPGLPAAGRFLMKLIHSHSSEIPKRSHTPILYVNRPIIHKIQPQHKRLIRISLPIPSWRIRQNMLYWN